MQATKEEMQHIDGFMTVGQISPWMLLDRLSTNVKHALHFSKPTTWLHYYYFSFNFFLIKFSFLSRSLLHPPEGQGE